jgi:hypothetical protein
VTASESDNWQILDLNMLLDNIVPPFVRPKATGLMRAIYLTLSTFAVSARVLAQDANPAPIVAPLPSGEEIIAKFEAAAPNLYAAWLQARAESLKNREVGLVRMSDGPGVCSGTGFYEFVECADLTPPGHYDLDVKKTDSILYPYKGVLSIPVHVGCLLHRAVPRHLMAWSKKNLDSVAQDCLGKTFAECTARVAKPAPAGLGVGCTGGPGYAFDYAATATLTFRWSRGSWEFESEAAPPPMPEHGTTPSK